MVLGLIVSHPHFAFKVLFGLYEVKLADKLDKVIAAKSLSVLLREFIFINLEDLDFVTAQFRTTILDKDVELDKLQSIISTFTGKDNPMIWVHAR